MRVPISMRSPADDAPTRSCRSISLRADVEFTRSTRGIRCPRSRGRREANNARASDRGDGRCRRVLAGLPFLGVAEVVGRTTALGRWLDLDDLVIDVRLENRRTLTGRSTPMA
jgi:hypothetical protein